MDPFVEQLASLCRTDVTRAKWVFVPTHAIGRTIGERIALQGTNWLNLRFVTPLDVALRMGAPFLVERGIDPSEEGLGPALVMRLMLDLPEQGGYFRPLADQPTMAQALWKTIRELRMAGVRSEDLKAEAFESAAKHAELRALLAAYESFLAASNRGDMATVYGEAMKHADWCPIQPEDCWTELPYANWNPLQRRLIESMPGERIVPCALDLPDAAVPRRLKDRCIERIAPIRDDNPLAFLMQADAAAASAHASSVELFRAGGREAEIEEVFRRILQAGVSLDQVEIACASSEYATLAWEKACRHAWPVTVATGIPAAITRPGRALLAWCDWIDGRFAAVDLRHMLQSGDVALDLPVELSAGKAARLLARAEATWGRDTYALALTRLAREYRQQADDEERGRETRQAARENLAACDALKDWIQALLLAVPEADADGRVSLTRMVAAAETFAGSCCDCKSALDGAARQALHEEIAELHALDRFRCSVPHALGFIRERVAGLAIAPDRPRPGHLYISTLPQAAYASRPLLFVVGLEEGGVFPAAVEDPVLLDAERSEISALLPLSSDRTDEVVWQVLFRLATCGEARDRTDSQSKSARVCLSYSSLDTREYRESLPSWLLLHACRVAKGEPGLTYDGLRKHLGEPVSCVPAATNLAVTDAGWWLAGVKSAPDAGRPHVLRRFGQVARGLEAAEKRASACFTEYDGFAPAAGAAFDPVAHAFSVSATSLEDAATCPQRYFIRRCLRVEPVPDAERERDAWLDPLTRGAELHDLFAALMRRSRRERRRPDLKKDRWIFDRAAERLEALSTEMPPPSPEVFDRERRDFLRDVELFVEREAGFEDREPVGFEVSFGRVFGRGDGEEVERLARREPVAISLRKGRELLLTGRIDRIDRVGASTYDVVDYKTGYFKRDKWEGTFAGGTRLQHAIYGIAASELLRPLDASARVRKGVYFFASTKGGHERVEIPYPGVRVTAAVLEDLVGVIASGAFVHTTDENDCRFCDFGRACGRGAPERAARKVEEPGESRLDVFRRLAEHE